MSLRTFTGILVVAVIQGIAQHHANIGLTTGKPLRKTQDQQPVPTFFGSDGQVRKVSPAAILDEVKRCLPPGLLIPIGTMWPELPPHLKETEGSKQGVGDEHLKHLPDVTQNMLEENVAQQKKRVMRSSDASSMKNISWEIKDPTEKAQSMNVKLEGPQGERDAVIQKEPNSNKMVDILKELISRHLDRKNKTDKPAKGDYVATERQLRRLKMADEYEDYDYGEVDGGNMAYRANEEEGRRANRIKARRLGRKMNRRKSRSGLGKKVLRKNRHELREKDEYNTPNYDYMYDDEEDLNEKGTDGEAGKLHSGFKAWAIRADELEKQTHLNGFSRRNSAIEREASRDLDLSKLFKRVQRWRDDPSGTHVDYKKMLSVVMALNSKLVKLLEKATQHKMYTSTQKEDNENAHPAAAGSSSLMWDFMDLLMRVKRETRSKTDYDFFQEVKQDAASRSVGKTDVNLLNRLLKWYLDSTNSSNQ